jgi:hypothetical protein
MAATGPARKHDHICSRRLTTAQKIFIDGSSFSTEASGRRERLIAKSA